MDKHIKEMIENNIPLVEHIVTRMSAGFPRHIERSEFVHAGLMGLVESCMRFDPDRGVAFSTFAGRRIEGAILDVVRKEDWLPRSVRVKARELDRAEESFSHNGRKGDASEAQVASAAGMTVAEVRELRRRIMHGVIVSLDRYVRAGDSTTATLGETIPDLEATDPEEMLEGRELKAYVRSAIHLLPERHRLVVVGYFLEERPMDEIAALLGVTQSRVSQLKDDALKRIREGVESQYREPAEVKPSTRRRDRSRAEYAAAIAAADSPLERLTVPSELTTI